MRSLLYRCCIAEQKVGENAQFAARLWIVGCLQNRKSGSSGVGVSLAADDLHGRDLETRNFLQDALCRLVVLTLRVGEIEHGDGAKVGIDLTRLGNEFDRLIDTPE